MSKRVVSISPLLFLLIGLLFVILNIGRARGLEGYTKILLFEDDFEDGLADFWNEIHGTPDLSTDQAHSGSYSYVTDEDWDSIAHLWFDKSIIGELEVWVYDSMLGDSTNTVSTTWNPHYIIAAMIWRGGDHDLYYTYRIGLPPQVTSSHPRSIGWHKVNIIHEPERAYILLDGELLVEVDRPVEFKGFSIGDNWLYNTISFIYYDDVKVWRYEPIPEHVIPEVPLGTIMISTAMTLVFAAYFVVPKWRKGR